jgi:predicted metal-dependent phosphotriesterase family hydrolase
MAPKLSRREAIGLLGVSAGPVPVSFSDDIALMVEETKAAAKDGVACLVDGGHPDMDRDLDALKRIATESGVLIVGSRGFYMQRTYPKDIATRTSDHIADELVCDATAQRLGAFGEIGQQGGVLTDDERKVFTAVGKAQARTGLPIFTHNPYPGARVANPPVPMDAALRQLDVLEAAGVNPISSDFSNGRGLKKNGGPGLAQTVTAFGPMLTKAGVSEATLGHILVDNSRRFLAFVPKAG